MALEIEWLEPPLSIEERLKEALKRQPGRWARIKKSMASPTSRTAWRNDGFEAVAHPAESDPKRYDIYARWPVGGDPRKLVPDVPEAPAGAAAVVPGKPKVHTDVNGMPVPVLTPAKATATGGYKYRGNDHGQVTAEELHRTGVRP